MYMNRAAVGERNKRTGATAAALPGKDEYGVQREEKRSREANRAVAVRRTMYNGVEAVTVRG